MKNFLRVNKIILIFILITIIGAMSVIGTRIGIESDNKTYDIVIDYREMEKLVEQSSEDMSWWLTQFADIGIKKVGVQEENIMTLMEESWMPVTGKVMGNVMENSAWQSELPSDFMAEVESKGGFDRFDVLITTGSEEAASFVIKGITERFPKEKHVITQEGEKAYVWLDGTSDTTLYSESYKYMNSNKGGFAERMDIVGSKLMYISLGLLEEKVDIIQNCGMEVIPRTLSYNGWNDTKYAEAVIEGYESFGILPEYIIVGGEAVFGYDDGIDFAKNYILDNGVTIGLIENTTQLQNIMQYGVDEVAQASGYDTVRVFSVWNYIQYRYQYYGYEGAKEIENTLFRAITERNVRVIYFKPFLEFKDLHTYITNMEEYEELFDNLENRLERHGFTFGSASIMDEFNVNKWVQMLIGMGCALGAVLLLRTLIPIKGRATLALSILGVLAVLGAYFAAPNTAVLVTAFAAAIVFACIAVTFYIFRARLCAEKLGSDASLIKIIPAAAVTLIISVIIALIGGIMTAAPISSTGFMLEIDIFRGVKLSQLLPLAYFVIAFLAYYGYGSGKKELGRLEWADIKEFVNLEIKVWMVMAMAVVGGIGVYYILRTGHDSSIEVSSFEMLFRNKLEEVLIARPRNKEFLFAFPAVMVTVYCTVRRMKLFSLLFGLAGVLGMTSVINTFMHIRTPLYLGFARTGYSLLFGMILGAAAILIFDGLRRLYLRYIAKYV